MSDRPLPRSLDPLPDESLPGYLLRLAHRLECTPQRVFALTLAEQDRVLHPSRVSHELMVALQGYTRTNFAAKTRLSVDEADSLCLKSLESRYPIPPNRGRADRRRRYGSQAICIDWWIFTQASRYCPECLAGDGSEIQRAHGGPWLRSWRLPIVFACPKHRRMLHHLCPDCGHAAQYGPRAGGLGGRVPLVPGPMIGGLEPAQCRWTIPGRYHNVVPECAARFDRGIQPIAVPPDVLSLQERLLTLLYCDAQATVAGKLATAREYFTDLRLMSHLLQTNWDSARDVLPPVAFSAQVEEGVDHWHETERGELAPALYSAKPLDPRTGAGLLLAADYILRKTTTLEVWEVIRHLLPVGTFRRQRTGWWKHFVTSESQCSEGLRRAGTPLVRTDSRAFPQARRLAELPVRFRPQHIPQWIPDELYLPHLGDVEGMGTSELRRDCAPRLYQMVFGGSIGDARHYLGMWNVRVPGRQQSSAFSTPFFKSARSRANLFDIDQALAAVAADLETSDLIDYRSRRLALRNWSIDPASWLVIVESVAATALTLSSDRHRNFASKITWALATSGMLLYAPTPIRDGDVASNWSSYRTRPEWASPQTRTLYAPRLVRALGGIAAAIAELIDGAAGAGSADVSGVLPTYLMDLPGFDAAIASSGETV